MPDIHIRRDHALGLAKARKLALQWAEDAEKKFEMACTLIEGDVQDTLEFTRSGVNGRLLITADQFDLEARLGLLFGAFGKTIQAEIEKNFDALLAPHAAAQAPKAAKTEAKTTAKAAPKSAASKAAAPKVAGAAGAPAAKKAK